MIWSKEETLPREEIEKIQLERLQETVARVYANVEPYRKKMDDIGLLPGDIKGIEDLNRATNESKKIIADAKKENDKLGYSFKTLVSELAAAEKNSIAWQTRIAILKRDYPDLVEELKLTEVFLHSTSDAYKNLYNLMDVYKMQNTLFVNTDI